MKFKLGIYRNLKNGKLYKVIGVGKHSETLEDQVFYEALYKNKVSKFWIRPLKMFTEEVVGTDGTKRKRFLFVSQN